jgi:hypothetical protein
MKSIIKTLYKICLLVATGLVVFSTLPVKGGELIIINDTLIWSMNEDTTPHGYNWSNGPIPNTPTNWVSPDNYYDGEIYTRYEIISEATSEPCALQFGIWQWWPPNPPEWPDIHHGEMMETQRVMNGPGSIVENHMSPSDMWTLREGVSFYKMDEIHLWGIMIWSLKPNLTPDLVIAGHNMNVAGREAEADALWADRGKWFPIKVRVTVIAVSAGSTFSGWENYIGIKPATPDYAVSYSDVKTNKVIPSTDEYSYSATMSPAFSGNGSKLSLTPGQDVYFRAKAEGYNPASDIQHLVVPARPSAPSYTVDYAAEKTSENVSSDIEYAALADFSSATSGTANKVTLTPDQDLYFRVKSTGSSFASPAYLLNVPARPGAPTVTVDYSNENTVENILSTMEYSSGASMLAPIGGTGLKLVLTPGTDIYVRLKTTASAFASQVTHLSSPARPATPNITVDFSSEKTSVISGAIEYSTNISMASPVNGQDLQVTASPGVNLYIRVKATASSFASLVKTLTIPARPPVPAYSINYSTEKTVENIATGDEYTANSDMTGSVSGTNAFLSLVPGTDLYFRTKVTGSSFRSGIQHLVVSARPAMPVYTIDFANEWTVETVPGTVGYSTSLSFTSSSAGSGARLTLTPGQNVYFRVMATVSGFAGNVSTLEVPARPFLGYSGNDTVSGEKFIMYALLDNTVPAFELSDLTVTNGQALNLRSGNVFDIYPSAIGDVRVKIPANKLQDNQFASNEVTVYYMGITGLQELNDNSLSIYPVPSYDGIIHISGNLSGRYTGEVLTLDGRIIRQFNITENEAFELDLHDLTKGLYYIRVFSGDTNQMQKIILY